MTTNLQDTRPAGRPGDPLAVEPKPVPTPVINPSGVGGVAVYDQGPDVVKENSLHPSASLIDDPAPLRTQSSGAIISWIIGIVVLLVLAYFFLQMIF